MLLVVTYNVFKFYFRKSISYVKLYHCWKWIASRKGTSINSAEVQFLDICYKSWRSLLLTLLSPMRSGASCAMVNHENVKGTRNVIWAMLRREPYVMSLLAWYKIWSITTPDYVQSHECQSQLLLSICIDLLPTSLITNSFLLSRATTIHTTLGPRKVNQLRYGG